MTPDPERLERLRARAAIIKAMAHPSRLLMVEELSGGERCVCDLTELVGADMSTVSKHLSVLKRAGIVEDRRQGTTIYYRLRCPCILGFFECVDGVLAPKARTARPGACTSCGR